MENMNAEKNAGRKKLLVPLVVLIMCGVALTGAAYALATSVTLNNSPITGDFYSIDMYGENEATTPFDGTFEAGTDFEVYTTKNVSDGYYVAKIDQTEFTRTVFVMVSSDVDDSTYKLSLAPITVTQSGSLQPTITAVAAMYNVTQSEDVTAGETEVNVGDYIRITVTFTVTGSNDAGHFATVDLLDAAVNATRTFSLAVTATLVES